MSLMCGRVIQSRKDATGQALGYLYFEAGSSAGVHN